MTSKLLLAVTTAALAITGTASAQWIGEGALYEHGLSINLQLVSEGAYTRNTSTNGNYTESQKIVTKKLSNKEILEALKQDGLISSITGWSIVLITNDEGEVVGTRINKKNTPSIDISEYFSANDKFSVQAYNGRYVANKRVYQAVGQIVTLAEVEIDIDDFQATAQGVLNANYLASGEDRMLTVSARGEKRISITEVIQNATFTNLTGEFEDDSTEDYVEGIVTGSVVAGPPTKIAAPRVIAE
ncbi:MAG: hypothetical protein CFE44_02595 [Burkholderiales bacterium PBB4]|nr:MAG: hypothetical protein CFE44_02595 [Burkholderiales bacterium PBB4]